MSKNPLFTGACTAVITPFADGEINYPALGRNIDRQYEAGSSAIVICGTTGENATLTENEYLELIRYTVSKTAHRMTVIAGIGGNNTVNALKNALTAGSLGADGVLMVTPYYNKTTQSGLVEHFTYVADRSAVPVILYNVPSRTGMSIMPETYKTLSEHPNINGVKEACGDISLIGKTMGLCGEDLNIWSGNDDNTLPMMAMGAKGVISVAGNIVPEAVAKLCSLCLNGDFPAATALNMKYLPLFSALFCETNPIPVKAAMALTGLDSGELRLPLVNISKKNLAYLREILVNSGITLTDE